MLVKWRRLRPSTTRSRIRPSRPRSWPGGHCSSASLSLWRPRRPDERLVTVGTGAIIVACWRASSPGESYQRLDLGRMGERRSSSSRPHGFWPLTVDHEGYSLRLGGGAIGSPSTLSHSTGVPVTSSAHPDGPGRGGAMKLAFVESTHNSAVRCCP